MTQINSNDNNVIYINGKKFDLNLLDKLKGEKSSSSIWAKYDSTAKYGNGNSIFDADEIQAIKDDLMTVSKSGNLDESGLKIIFKNPVDVFKAEIDINKMIFLKENEQEYQNTKMTCQPVSIKVREKELEPLERKVPQEVEKPKPKKTEKVEESKQEKPQKKSYIEEFKDYVPNDLDKFNKVWRYAATYTDKSKAKSITKMVCALSERYGIDSEIIMPMLKHETGGFVFEKRTMDPENKKYKGVMQVSPGVMECLYANPDDTHNAKLSLQERKYANEHRRFSADELRIQELFEQYKTPDELYEAIKTDVTLGLEVGIMAYKSKLTYTNGDTRKALRLYCGDNYSLPKDTGAPKKIWPIPEYKMN